MVGVEDVAGDHDEGAPLLGGDLGGASDGVEAVLREAGPRLFGKEVRLHAEMPVGGVGELNHR